MDRGDDNPGPLDWALAAMALVSLLYPLLVFDDFARRVVRPTGLDALPLVASELGRRTLVVEGRRLPLFRPGGDPARLVLSVRR